MSAMFAQLNDQDEVVGLSRDEGGVTGEFALRMLTLIKAVRDAVAAESAAMDVRDGTYKSSDALPDQRSEAGAALVEARKARVRARILLVEEAEGPLAVRLRREDLRECEEARARLEGVVS